MAFLNYVEKYKKKLPRHLMGYCQSLERDRFNEIADKGVGTDFFSVLAEFRYGKVFEKINKDFIKRYEPKYN